MLVPQGWPVTATDRVAPISAGSAEVSPGAVGGATPPGPRRESAPAQEVRRGRGGRPLGAAEAAT